MHGNGESARIALRKLVDHWLTGFDRTTQEGALNRLP